MCTGISKDEVCERAITSVHAHLLTAVISSKSVKKENCLFPSGSPKASVLLTTHTSLAAGVQKEDICSASYRNDGPLKLPCHSLIYLSDVKESFVDKKES